jgi:hypothetical protein
VGRGTLTGDFQWFVQRDSPGVLVMDMSRLTSLAGGAGSLLELQFRAKPAAEPRDVALDLQWVELNEGRLTLNPAPRTGADPTDGLLRVLPRPAEVRSPRPLAAPGLLRGAQALPLAQGPTIDFSQRYGNGSLGAWSDGNGASGWKTEFVTQLARNDDERNPNDRMRITLPTTTKLAHRAAAGVKPVR